MYVYLNIGEAFELVIGDEEDLLVLKTLCIMNSNAL